MADRKVVARATSVIEAQAIQSILEGAEIECFIDNANISNILPYETQAFGGVTVSVWEQDEAKAKQLLESELETIVDSSEAQGEDTPSDKREGEFRKNMKLAIAGAVIGSFLLPIISNVYSIVHLNKAYQVSPKLFWTRKGSIAITLIFNALTIVVIALIVMNSKSAIS